MARKRKGQSKSSVKAMIKKEVGKTRETQKLVSYLVDSKIPPLLDSITIGEGGPGLILSLTGGVSPQDTQTVMTPGTYNDKVLFVLLPAGSELSGVSNVQQAGQGGMGMAGDTVANEAIGGVHMLEGRECYLKKWYCTMTISNSPQVVIDPRPCFVRMFVIETRRPLAATNIAQQIFLQNHAVRSMAGAAAATPQVQTVCSYINRAVVKKVYYDKIIKLTGPAGSGTAGGSSSQLYCKKFSIQLKKKAHWAYYYATRNPNSPNDKLVYSGPFIYFVALSNQNNPVAQPVIALNTMLTFYDD